MPVIKVLARRWKVEVKDATTGEFIKIGGLTQLGFSGDKTDADTTDFDSDGAEEHIVASRSKSVTFEGHYLEDPVNGARDVGQEAVEEIGELTGEESLGDFRLTSPAGTVRTFRGSVNVGEVGGANNDPTKWSATVTVSGKIVKA